MSDEALGWDAPTTEDTEVKKLEPGVYEFSIERLEKGRYENGEDSCNTATFHVKVQGRTIWDTYWLRSSSVHKLQATLKSIGKLDTAKSLGENCDSAVGVKGKCEVYIEESKKLDQSGNPYKNERIKQYKVEAGAPQQEQPAPKDW